MIQQQLVVITLTHTHTHNIGILRSIITNRAFRRNEDTLKGKDLKIITI